jgi:beta-galactosidase
LQGNRGRTYGYGGDFEDEYYVGVNDKQFCINGLFSPDRHPHPAVSEVKYLQQPIHLIESEYFPNEKSRERRISSSSELLQFRFINYFSSLSWSDVYVEYYYSSDHKKDLNCNMTDREIFSYFPTAGRSKECITLKTFDRAQKYLSEYNRCWITFKWYFRSKMKWQLNNPDKNPIAIEKVELILPSPDEYHNIEINKILREEGCSINVQEATSSVELWVKNRGNRFMRRCAVIDKTTGCMTSFCNNARSEMLTEPMVPNFTRACTDNDRGGIDRVRDLMPRWVAFKIRLLERTLFNYSYWYKWKRIGLDPESPPRPVCNLLKLVGENSDHAIIEADITMVTENGKRLFQLHILYHFRCDGSVKVSTIFEKPNGGLRYLLPSLPRIGYTFCMNRDLKNVTYLGRGPEENYPDRKSGSMVGVWSMNNNLGYDYIVPSENGNRTDCSWLLLENNSNGFLIVACQDGKGPGHFSFSTLLHNQRELHRATHTHQLEARSLGTHPLFVNIDLYQMGIGGDVGWSPCVYDDYLLKPDRYESR